jgi:hypothetical protein
MNGKQTAGKYAKAYAKGQDAAVVARVEAGRIALELWRGSKSKAERLYAVRLCVDECLAERVLVTEREVVDTMRAALLAERFPRVAELRSTELLRPLLPLVTVDDADGSTAWDWAKGVQEGDVAALVEAVVSRTGEYELPATNKELREKLTDAVRRLRNAKQTAKRTPSLDVTAWVGKFTGIPCAAQVDAVLDLIGMLTPAQLEQVRDAMETPAHDTVLEPAAA